MKKNLALILIMLICSQSIFASELVAQDAPIYVYLTNSKQIPNAAPLNGNYLHDSYYTSTDTVNWELVQKGKNISTENFLRQMGYSELADDYHSIKNYNRNMKLTGFACLIGGALTAITGANTGNKTLIYVGAGLSVISLPFFTLHKDQNLTVNFALGIVDQFNQAIE